MRKRLCLPRRSGHILEKACLLSKRFVQQGLRQDGNKEGEYR